LPGDSALGEGPGVEVGSQIFVAVALFELLSSFVPLSALTTGWGGNTAPARFSDHCTSAARDLFRAYPARLTPSVCLSGLGAARSQELIIPRPQITPAAFLMIFLPVLEKVTDRFSEGSFFVQPFPPTLRFAAGQKRFSLIAACGLVNLLETRAPPSPP